jgi:hypothetical protein
MFMIDRHGKPGRGDLDHQNADGVVGVLRLLHRKTHQIVSRQVDILWGGGVEFSGQVAREDGAVLRLVAQLDADLGAFAVDELCRVLAADQGHVVTGHQELGCQQGAIGGSEN